MRIAVFAASEHALTSTDQYDAFGQGGTLASGGGGEQPIYVQRGGGTTTNPAAAGTVDPFGYGAQWGYVTDAETGLVLCGQRYYDPAAARWVTRDPIGFRGGVNLYAYCRNRPVGWADPIGLWYVSIGVGAIGILGIDTLGLPSLGGGGDAFLNIGPEGMGYTVDGYAGVGAGAGVSYGLEGSISGGSLLCTSDTTNVGVNGFAGPWAGGVSMPWGGSISDVSITGARTGILAGGSGAGAILDVIGSHSQGWTWSQIGKAITSRLHVVSGR